MKSAAMRILAAPLSLLCAEGLLVSHSRCETRDFDNRVLLQTTMSVHGIQCEEMCKEMGIYPNCQCPGFEGQPPTAEDARKCYTQHCQDKANPCPNTGFVVCVKDTTMVSPALLQWATILQRFGRNVKHSRGFAALQANATSGGTSCSAMDLYRRSAVEVGIASLGVVCEDMCKEIGEYPNCQCPGFDGQPATAGDERQCFDKHCQDLNDPCPNDSFVTCVGGVTGVSALQWPSLLKDVGTTLTLYQKTLAHVWNKPHNH